MTDEGGSIERPRVATPAELAAARESRRMSQVDISQRIKLQVKQVNALEEGQWDTLPGKSFVRGALRSYGKLLDVDVDPLLESIGGYAEPAQVHDMRPLETSLSRTAGNGYRGDHRGGTILWVVSGLIGVVALVLYFGADEDTLPTQSWLPSVSLAPSEPSPGPATPPASAAPSGTPESSAAGGAATAPSAPSAPVTAAPPTLPPAPLPATSPSASSSPSPAASPQSTAPAATASASAPAAASSSAPATGSSPSTASSTAPTTAPTTASSTAAAPATGGQGGATAAGSAQPGVAASGQPAKSVSKGTIRMKAGAKDSWVEVREADGSALHNGLVKAGDTLELNGRPPYRLVIGNASHLEVVYEGRVQDLGPHMRTNNIARLELK